MKDDYDDYDSNVVSLFWYRYQRIKPIAPEPPLTTDQKIKAALEKQRQKQAPAPKEN